MENKDIARVIKTISELSNDLNAGDKLGIVSCSQIIEMEVSILESKNVELTKEITVMNRALKIESEDRHISTRRKINDVTAGIAYRSAEISITMARKQLDYEASLVK